MKVIGIIPSRYNSSRFPGKPLIDLKGKTMIQRVYEGAKKCPDLDKVIVATDDERIFQHVLDFGGEVMMTSSNHSTGTDRCAEVVNQFSDFDIAINIQGDEPLVDAKQLSQLIQALKEEKTEIATLGILTNSFEEINNPNRIKIVCNKFQNALYFSRSVIPFQQKTGEKQVDYLRHIGLYGFKTNVLKELAVLEPTLLEEIESLEQLRWLYHGFSIKVVKTTIETPNIDAPEDIEKVLHLL